MRSPLPPQDKRELQQLSKLLVEARERLERFGLRDRTLQEVHHEISRAHGLLAAYAIERRITRPAPGTDP